MSGDECRIPPHQVLFLGEGDFSFSHSVARQLWTAKSSRWDVISSSPLEGRKIVSITENVQKDVKRPECHEKVFQELISQSVLDFLDLTRIEINTPGLILYLTSFESHHDLLIKYQSFKDIEIKIRRFMPMVCTV